MKAPRLVLLAGGRKPEEGEGESPPVSRASLRLLRGGDGRDLQETIQQTVEEARRLRSEIEQRIARALQDEPKPSPEP